MGGVNIGSEAECAGIWAAAEAERESDDGDGLLAWGNSVLLLDDEADEEEEEER